jgi:hypothetical protein
LYEKIQNELKRIKENPDISDYFQFYKMNDKDNQFKEVKENLLNSIDDISRDIRRTFRSAHNNSSPEELGRVLESISFIKRDIGYCQGMNFIAGGLLKSTGSEEKAFWLFLIFLNEYELNNMFTKVIKKIICVYN